MFVMILMPLDLQTGKNGSHAQLEQRIVSRSWIPKLLLLCKCNRSLCKAFKSEILNLTFFSEFNRRLYPIARIPRT